MRRAVILLAWWFVITGWIEERGRVVGPFADQRQCEEIRSKFNHTTPCWWDGKP